MGLNIVIERPDDPWPAEHPDWDPTKYGCDRQLWDIMKAVRFDQREAPGFPFEDDRQWYRPADFAAFRAALPTDPDWDRMRLLADILEADPRYWIYMSV